MSMPENNNDLIEPLPTALETTEAVPNASLPSVALATHAATGQHPGAQAQARHAGAGTAT